MSGVRLAALYSIAPHKLGLCGPQKKSIRREIYNFLCGKKNSQRKIRKILEGFRGAFFYYKLIAKSNSISNPFDKKVVRAYWIGNELLERVKIEDLRQMIAKDFSKPEKARKIPEDSKPHHSFHVLIAGPINKKIILKGKLLDFCKVSWGRVIKISDLKFQISKLLVEYQPLMKDKKYTLGEPIKKEIFWDKKILPKIKMGDWVSFHWNLALEKLQDKDIKNLQKYTRMTLKGMAEMKKVF